MVEHFGWTLEYVRGLPVATLHEWLTIRDARAKGLAEHDRRANFLRNPKGGKR